MVTVSFGTSRLYKFKSPTSSGEGKACTAWPAARSKSESMLKSIVRLQEQGQERWSVAGNYMLVSPQGIFMNFVPASQKCIAALMFL